MAEGPEAAMAIVDHLGPEPALRGYHLMPSVRGDLLAPRKPIEIHAAAVFR
jgi:predicted RNA polymerase sigma factor